MHVVTRGERPTTTTHLPRPLDLRGEVADDGFSIWTVPTLVGTANLPRSGKVVWSGRVGLTDARGLVARRTKAPAALVRCSRCIHSGIEMHPYTQSFSDVQRASSVTGPQHLPRALAKPRFLFTEPAVRTDELLRVMSGDQEVSV